MHDDTEAARRQRLAEINGEPKERAELEVIYGEVFDTRQLASAFIVLGFAAPFIAVKRKSDGLRGSLEFQAAPRYYFNFVAD